MAINIGAAVDTWKTDDHYGQIIKGINMSQFKQYLNEAIKQQHYSQFGSNLLRPVDPDYEPGWRLDKERNQSVQLSDEESTRQEMLRNIKGMLEPNRIKEIQTEFDLDRLRKTWKTPVLYRDIESGAEHNVDPYKDWKFKREEDH